MLNILLHLADDALILGHRNSEWTGHGPILEQDIALSNIALDLIGQSRNFYQLATTMKNDGCTEDHLAFLRDAPQFLNSLLVEQENGHWGKTVLRQFFFSVYASWLYRQLQEHEHRELAAIAAKSLKEIAYHLRWSSEWVIRLGKGTPESNVKMQDALNELWPYTAELYTPAEYEKDMINFQALEQNWKEQVHEVLSRANLQIPQLVEMQSGGKNGNHSPLLALLLAEMQYMQRTYPGMEW